MFGFLSIVKLANEKLSVPITCKIRVFKEMDKTVRYAQMLEKAGCQVFFDIIQICIMITRLTIDFHHNIV